MYDVSRCNLAVQISNELPDIGMNSAQEIANSAGSLILESRGRTPSTRVKNGIFNELSLGEIWNGLSCITCQHYAMPSMAHAKI